MTVLSTADLLAALDRDESPRSTSRRRIRRRKSILRLLTCVHVFDPATLATTEAFQALRLTDPAGYLLDDIIPAVGWSAEGLWTLSRQARREALALSRTREQLFAARREFGRTVASEIQIVLDAWLRDDLHDMRNLSSKELSALRTLADWGFDTFWEFPDRTAIERAWRRRSLFADFEALAAGFVGRRRELQALHHFMDQPAASGRAMIVSGVGGVGKSALISRFVLDLSEERQDRAPPFIYLALDDPALDPAEPYTLLAAAASQLHIQVRNSGEFYAERAVDDVRQSLEAYMRERRGRKQRGSRAETQRVRLAYLRGSDLELGRAFNRMLAEISESYESQPILFIIDTFEEATYRSSSDLFLFYETLENLVREVQALRLLLIGRGRPEEFDVPFEARPLVLGDLARRDAHAFLAQHGVANRLAEEVIASFGRNPLTLKLLLGAMARGEHFTRDANLAVAGEEVIRGYLYRRILDHIHDPVVRSLAHPGMVLRRITPEIISDVMLTVYNLSTDQSPELIFEELAKEHTLVGRAPDGALTFREEIRVPMLRLIEKDQPKLVEALHQAAVWYYARFGDDTSREEELYHRLAGAEPESVSDFGSSYFPIYIAVRLLAVIDDFSSRGRVELSRLIDFEVPGEDLEAADTDDRDRRVAQRVYSALRADDYQAALEALDIDIEPGSALAPLRVRVLKELGEPEEAAVFGHYHIDYFPPFANRIRQAELMWFVAQCDPDDLARVTLRQLAQVVESLSPLTQVQVLTALVLVEDPDLRSQRIEELTNALARISLGDTVREGKLIRLALVQVGPQKPDLWQDLGAETIDDLPQILLEQDEARAIGAAQAAVDFLGGATTEWLRSITTELEIASGTRSLYRLCSALARALRQGLRDPQLLAAVWTMFKAEETSLHAASLAGIDHERDLWERPSSAASEAVL
ncbi:AAA family ATPase [Rhizobium leguminosarum]|nr:ATP-binding protein [Rhizobium ruizarguesonis]NEJ17724.1 AAA family ATPase [Rhizobium ruizarguesonis]NEK31702.1 AAA family ATPase [Rhizobium ruizarguesonis]